MEFRLFGEVRLWVAEQPLDMGTPRQQAVLAVLAVDAGRPVPIETLIDRVWGDNPPAEARNVLYSHLSRIRRLLAEAGDLAGIDQPKVNRRSGGYVLEVDPNVVDLHKFTHMVERGNDPGATDADRAEALTEALRGWRGTPLAGIPGDWADQVRAAWHRRRVDAAVQWGEVELGLGRARAVIDTMSDLAEEYPLAEPLEALLIKALHAAGRDAEAVDRYAIVRARLADALGTDPGPELRALHRAILRGELPPVAHGPQPTAPAQLPPDTPAFAGRDAELRRLDDVVDGQRSVTRIVILSGTAGVGKTALAVHWAHTVGGGFAGGQLYVNLRGFDPTGSPVSPTEAVRGFLEAFDVPTSRIPTGLEAQVGLYRSLVANRRVLVVLDNARDARQVRPLLPGAPGCVVLVTSRDELAGLVTDGAHPIPVELLDDAGAHAVLRGRIGAERVAAEPVATGEIVDLCARLPLALAVVAARAATHPRFSLAALAGQLRDARGRLDEFAGTDPATDPRAVFSWSYLRLDPAAARLFRLLGLHPGPDVGTRAAASTAALSVATVRPLLAELAHAHLITEPGPGRYTMHDLLRAYAGELVHDQESPADRAAATRRMLGHYGHTAYHADGFLDPRLEVPPTLTPLAEGAESERITDHGHALAWFRTEYRVALMTVHQAPEFDAEVWELVWSIRRFLAMQGHWHDEIESLTAALAAARRLGDRVKQAFAHCYLGCTYIWFSRYVDADQELAAALELYRQADDIVGQAYVHHYFAWMLERQTDIAGALPHAEQALDLFRVAEHQAGQAKSLNAVGWFHGLLGQYGTAVEYCQEALELQQRLGDHLNAGQTWHSLGWAHGQLGDDVQAMACYEAAIDLFHRKGHLAHEAHVLISLADLYQDKGDLEAARTGWRRAYDILTQIGHPDAEQLGVKLSSMANGEEPHV